MSLRKSSRSRNGSKSEVLPNPNARRKCTPAPSSVGLDRTSRLMGRRDILTSREKFTLFWPCSATIQEAWWGGSARDWGSEFRPDNPHKTQFKSVNQGHSPVISSISELL